MSKRKTYLLIIGLLFFVFILWQKNTSNINKILKNPKFTIGIINSDYHHKTTFKPPGHDYYFIVGNETYHGVASTNTECNGKNIGFKFLVIYDAVSNNNFASLCFYPVPDNIRAPKNGWTLNEVPIEIDFERIKNFIK